MKTIRCRTLLLFLLFMLLMSMPAAAESMDEYLPYAQSLSELEVFLGTGSGYELDRAPTRIEGLVMLIRLLGAEDEVQSLAKFSIPFDDVPGWGKGYVVYAYKEGLTKGLSESRFGSSNSLNARAFTTFALRSLGYNDAAGDFSYQNSIVFANSIGLFDGNFMTILENEAFLRGHVARIAYETLRYKPKGEEVLLIEQLMSQGMVDDSVGNAFIENVIGGIVRVDPEEPGGKSTSEIALNAESLVLLEVETAQGIMTGSGVVIDEDGTIVTNFHVIEGGYKITVSFDEGSEYTGTVTVKDYDENLDLALLKVNRTGLPAVAIGSSEKMSLGDPVVAIGSPYGLLNSITEGIVSGFRDQFIQISAAISPGSSGGALFNDRGELVGITTAGIAEGENLGFAIKIEAIKELDGNMRLSLAKFSERTAEFVKPEPPMNLRIAQEMDGTACMQWDPVDQADFYYFYYQQQGEDTYWYDVNGDDQIRFYYQEDCSCYFNDLTKGMTYNVYVTSVKDGIESDPSRIFNFTWDFSKEDDYSHLFYSGHDDVPDFGRMFGILPEFSTQEIYLYNTRDFDDDAVLNYVEALEIMGIVYNYHYETESGNEAYVYSSNHNRTSVILSYEVNSTGVYLSIFIYD
jgi:S1-C subfamily serine protease